MKFSILSLLLLIGPSSNQPYISQYPLPCRDYGSTVQLSVASYAGHSKKIGDPPSTYTFSAGFTPVCSLFPDGTQDCCSDSIELNQFVDPSPPTSGLISFDWISTITFGQTSDDNDANRYYVYLQAKFTGQTAWSRTQLGTYYYTHTQCSSATMIISSQFPSLSTSVQLPLSSTIPGAYDNISGSALDFKCGPRYYTTSKPLKPATFVETSMGADFDWSAGSTIQLQILPRYQPAEVGSYTLQIFIYLDLFPTVSAASSVSLVITNCVLTSLKIVEATSGQSLIALHYALSSSSPVNTQLKVTQTPACGYTSTGWTVSQGNLMSGIRPEQYLNIDPQTGVYSIAPGKTRDSIGDYHILVTGVTLFGINNDWTSTTHASVPPTNFVLTVTTGCESTVLTANQVQPIFLTVWDSPALYPQNTEAFADFADSASTSRGDLNWCPKSYSTTITSLANGISLSEYELSTTSPRKFWISSQSYDQVGTYTAYLTATVVECPTIVKTTSFQITVLDPCLQTTLIAPPNANDMTTSILVQDSFGAPFYETQQIGVFNDSVSVAHGSSGTQYCSARIYSITSVPVSASTALSPTELMINSNSGLISVYTANTAKIGTHTVTVTAKLAAYQTITKTLPAFMLEVQPCIITDFNMVDLSPTYNKNYMVADPTLSWSIVGGSITTQVPACGYSQVLNTGNIPSILTAVTGASITFTSYSRNVLDANLHEIQVVSTLLNYNFSPPKVAPTSSSFLLLNVIDPCYATTISTVPTVIENFVAFAGYTTHSKTNYTFNDTDSISRTLNTDLNDFCGEKLIEFKTENITTVDLRAKNTEQIYFSPPINTKVFGLVQAQVVAHLRSYPNITSVPINFTITTLGSVVPEIKDQFYQVGQQELQIVYDSFKVLPEQFDVGNSSVIAYLLSEKVQIGEFIDLNCSCLQKISGLSWISLNESTNALSVKTEDNSLIGEHSIVLVQNFENFTDVHPYTQFKLTILPIAFVPTTPPFFQPEIPSVLDVVQCGRNQTTRPWYYQLPQILDPGNSPVQLQVRLDQSVFSFDNSTQTIIQQKIQDKPANYTFKFTLTSLLNTTASFKMKVQFLCPSKEITVYVPQLKQNIKQSNTTVKKPAWIGSISRKGVVEIKFYLDVFVPNFTLQTNDSHSNIARRLNTENHNLTLEDFINKDVLQIQLQTQQHLVDVDWSCLSFSKQLLKLQLNFTNPLEISQGHKDQLSVKFRQTDLFLLRSETEYLFHNQSDKILYFTVPRQLPVSAAASILQTVTDATETVGWGVIIGTLVAQFIAKKVITKMWIYYCALQIILLIVLHGKTQAPVSVEMVVSEIAGIINLSSLDKQAAAELLHLDSITQSAVFQSLDGVALSAIAIILVVTVLGLAIVISRNSPKVQEFLLKIKQTLFWNFLIRYFQASFIGFNFAALVNIQKKGAGFKDTGISVVILMIQYGLVCYVALILLKRDLLKLGTKISKSAIGNLYFNLDVRSRQKVLFGLVFFIQRSLLVMILSICRNSSIQWQLSQLVLQLNSAYLLTVRPYSDPDNATLDEVNCLFLLLISVLQSTYSVWNTEIIDRLNYGMGFDALIILQFLVNVFFILRQVTSAVILKVKQRQYRLKYRKRQRKNRGLHQQTPFGQQGALAYRKFNQPFSIQSEYLRYRQSIASKLPIKVDAKAQNRKKSFEEHLLNRKKRVTANQTLEIERQRNYLNLNMSQISEIDEQEYGILHQKEEVKADSTPIDLGRTLKSIAQTQLSELQANRLNGQKQRVQKNFTQNQPLNKRDLQPRKAPQKPLKVTVPKQQKTITTQQNESPKNEVTYVNVKTRNPVTPFSLVDRVRVKAADQVTEIPKTKLTPIQQQILNMEIQEYFQIGNRGVRRYPRDKTFTWQDDIWPYYKQVLDPSLKGPPISEDQHVHQMVECLKRLWVESYPEMPYLPLQVKVEFYLKTCNEIRPVVQRIVAEQKNRV